MIIVQGIIERYANNVEIQNIQGIGDRAVLQLVMGQPNPERNQQGNVVSPTAPNFKLLSTLNRNTRDVSVLPNEMWTRTGEISMIFPKKKPQKNRMYKISVSNSKKWPQICLL